jgi:Flp pilus assembly pilin Flp
MRVVNQGCSTDDERASLRSYYQREGKGNDVVMAFVRKFCALLKDEQAAVMVEYALVLSMVSVPTMIGFEGAMISLAAIYANHADCMVDLTATVSSVPPELN